MSLKNLGSHGSAAALGDRVRDVRPDKSSEEGDTYSRFQVTEGFFVLKRQRRFPKRGKKADSAFWGRRKERMLEDWGLNKLVRCRGAAVL